MKSRITKLLIVSIFIGLLASVVGTYLHVKNQPTQEPMPIATMSFLPEYRIESGRDLKVWPKGTMFEQGRAAYFYAAEPKVTITPVIKLEDILQGSLQGTLRSQVVIQSVDDKSQVYWSYKVKLSSPANLTFSQDSSHSNPLTYQSPDILLDVPAAYHTAIEIGDELLYQNGILQLLVISELTMNGNVNGSPIEKSMVLSFPINLLQTSFTLPKSEEAVTEVALTEQADTTSLLKAVFDVIRRNQVYFTLDITLLLLLLIMIMLNEMQKPRAAKEHLRFREWITEGSVEVQNRLSIQILSLEGLVDLAIDLDKRVIYDPKVHRYYVLTEDIVYIYDRERTRAILDNKQQLGKLLLNQGLIKPEQLEIGLYHQNRLGCRLGESLIALGFIDEATLYSTLASQRGIDYYELNPKKAVINSTWMNQLNVHQARALMAVPIGLSSDQSMIVASSEASREGIQDALEEIFGRKVHLVSSKPSAIYEVLDSFEKRERIDYQTLSTQGEDSSEQLNEEERKQFLEAYYRGSLRQDLFLMAMGMITTGILIQVPEKDHLLNWLSGKNLIHGDMANLIRGLSRFLQSLDYDERQMHQLPELPVLLYHSNHITGETKDWLINEAKLQTIPMAELLLTNFLCSEDTLRNAEKILKVLNKLIIQKDG